MKAKTIKQILIKKHEAWVKSIDSKELRAMARANTIITGGCIASLLLGEKVNDYDIYCTNKETAIALAEHYIGQFTKLNPDEIDYGHKVYVAYTAEDDRVRLKFNTRQLRPAHEPGFQFDEDPNEKEEFAETAETHVEDAAPLDPSKPAYRPVYLSANAITLSNQIQIVIRFYGDAGTIHENYDFDHCKCYWVSKTKELVLPAEALEALLTKELKYSGSKYPLASIIRTRKFINRGFTINAGQYLKMALQLNKLNLFDRETLEDQLIGMDAVYFAQLLAAIPEEKVIDGKIDEHYIMTLIDRFF
jgi:hypothetical protein